MAIKGKGKTRGGRPGANAPRTVIVIPKKPFLRRRSTRIGVVALLVAAVGATLFIGFRSQQDKKDLEKQGFAVKGFNNVVQLNLQQIGQPAPPTGVSILPNMVSDIDRFKKGDATPKEIRAGARNLPAAVQKSIDGLNAIKIPDVLRNRPYTIQLVDARFLMTRGLGVYRGVAGLLLAAADLRGPTRTKVLDRAQEQVKLAAELFDAGYQKLKNIRADLGVLDPSEFDLPGVQPGAPGT